jgi:hypothetical protein
MFKIANIFSDENCSKSPIFFRRKLFKITIFLPKKENFFNNTYTTYIEPSKSFHARGTGLWFSCYTC